MYLRTVIIDPEPLSDRMRELFTELSDEIRITALFRCAADAGTYLEQEGVDLLLWDLRAGEMGILRALRGVGCTTPIVLLMRHMDRALMTQAMALGITDCILKPCDPARLRHAVQNFLEQDRVLRSGGELTQDKIDHLLHHPLPSESGVRLLPKGLSPRTLATLEQMIRSHPDDDYTCESLSEASGLSKVTVRNYLNYLIEAGRLTCTTDYETGGRPRVLYRSL